MTEYIGSRISLISKSDIRYVGTLHEINSENSTVALEQVKSFGTEGRRQSPDDEIPGSDSVYEYIVFRGSDVKDLKIEEGPKENKAPPPQVPNDPAILGSGTRPFSQSDQVPPQQAPQGFHQNQPSHFQPPSFTPYQQYNQFHNQRFNGPQGLQPGFGGPSNGFQRYSGMPYGAPPGWYPSPNQGFPHVPSQFSPQHQQSVPYGGPRPPSDPSRPADETLSPSASNIDPQRKAPIPSKDYQTPKMPQDGKNRAESSTQQQQGSQPGATQEPHKAKTSAPINESLPASTLDSELSATLKDTTTAAKNSKIVPVVPLTTSVPKKSTKAKATTPQPAQQPTATTVENTKSNQPPADTTSPYQNSTQAATAAVAAAMSKLPPVPNQKPKTDVESNGMDNLTKKVHEMRTDDRNRHAGKSGSGSHANEHRGGRGGRRGGHYTKGLEVPTTDFDFESANAKFDKQNIAKAAEATGGPASRDASLALDGENGNPNVTGADVVIPPVAESYNKSSFFDNISSEAKDRELAVEGKRRVGGPEFRHEERKRNVETFGMGSVESGYRGGHRGRGGRGRGYRGGFGRGGGNRGGNAYRGARGGSLNTASASAARAAAAGG